ncbi:DnaJ domain-containing protein [Methylocella sp.]|uniref:DnaJ domain-containing protein n=1 Tax=Methylocella sp. TaxID=1978226 RepID=UPI0037841728
MIVLAASLIALWMTMVALRAFARANPVALARALRRGGGAAALLFAAFLGARGAAPFAMGFGALGFWLLNSGPGGGGRPFGWPFFGGWGGAGGFPFGSGSAAPPSGGGPRVSCVRSATIEMQLDHDTGRMWGAVLAGAQEGRELDALTRPECEALYDFCRRDDPEGARLLEAYLDRRFAGWREARKSESDAGSGASRRNSGAMTQDEAYEVLGLRKGASREEVVRSHRSLMKKLHPDHGGTTDLAARVNEAKEVLMRRHP